MPDWRAVLTRGLLILFGLFLTAVALELVLQTGALIARSTGHRNAVSQLADRRSWIAMGDSNTYGLYVEREEAYPSVLEKLWTAHDVEPIQVLNLGFPGTNSTTLVNNFAELTGSLSPQRVLILVGVNDIWTVHEPSTDSRGHSLDRSRSHAQLAWRWSRLYRLLFMLDTVLDVPELGGEFTPERPLGFETREIEVEVGGQKLTMGFKNDGTHRSDWDRILTTNLGTLHQMARETDIDFTVLTYPSEQENYQRANRVIRDWAHHASVEVVDLGAAFMPLCPNGECEELLADQHPSAAGYAFAAKVILDAILYERAERTDEGSAF